MSTSARVGGTACVAAEQIRLVRRLVDGLGGRYSAELGIDVDAGDDEIERWFVAATLFGTRIASSVAKRAFRTLDTAGLQSIAQAPRFGWDDLVALLDASGYTRYDYRTATRLHALGDAVRQRHHGSVAEIGRTFTTYGPLRAALDDLPGWGPMTTQLFLRELRGVWLGADPPLDERAACAGRHLGLLDPQHGMTVAHLEHLALAGERDPRDLESGLVRLSLAHHDRMALCPGGPDCTVLLHRPPREAS